MLLNLLAKARILQMPRCCLRDLAITLRTPERPSPHVHSTKVMRRMPHIQLRWIASVTRSTVTSPPPPAEPPSAAASPDLGKEEEAVVERLMEESVRRLRLDEDIDWELSMAVIKRTEEHIPLRKPTEDELFKIRATRPIMSLAALVNESPTLQHLVRLGVGLHHWEKHGHLGLAVKLEFETDVAPLVRFLADIGVAAEHIGPMLTLAPGLLEQSLEDLRTRVAYLASKRFAAEQIAHIVREAPRWLCFAVKGIDGRLGFFQKAFHLTGNEVRQLVMENPELILWEGTPHKVLRQNFSLKEEMGFTPVEVKEILLTDSRIFQHPPMDTLLQFELLHNVAGLPHPMLVKFPQSLIADVHNTECRYEFLKFMGRAQFNPSLPNYISPELLTGGYDEEFCKFAAKCELKIFYDFVRTL